MIKLVQRKDIDDNRWNSVIAASKHETIYPYTWYLDASADRWLGLIMNNYECIMPVAYRKKYGVKYFYQPFYNQQLGVFSKKAVDSEIVRMFLHQLPGISKLGDYAFNAANLLGEEPGFEIHDRHNYILPLDEEYDELYKKFSSNCRKNIRKACQTDLVLTENVTIDQLISLKKESEKIERGDEHYDRIKSMFSTLLEMKKARIFGLSCQNKLCSAALIAYSGTRLIYLLSASNAMGKEKRGMFKIIDSIIQKHAEEKLVLDFEGSDISSIARFFGGFGARPEIYQRVQYNNLPGFIHKLKKIV